MSSCHSNNFLNDIDFANSHNKPKITKPIASLPRDAWFFWNRTICLIRVWPLNNSLIKWAQLQNHTEQHESWTKKEIAQNSMTLLHLESTGCIAETSPGDCSVNILYMWQAWFGEKRDWIVFSWLSKQVVWQLSMISKLPQAWRHTHWNSSH